MASEHGGDAGYAADVRMNPGVTVDGYTESEAEHAGIGRVRHWLTVLAVAFVALTLGATAVAVTDWWTSRPNPTIQTLNPEQYQVLLAAADKNGHGFNNKAIVALKANGYKPVAQSVDHNTDTYYVVLVKCSGDYRACAEQIEPTMETVVYLGIPNELAQRPPPVRFIATQVQVDYPLPEGRIQRCSVYRGKVLLGEAGPVTYDLPKTLGTLKLFADERKFTDESPDGDASFWACAPEKVG